MGGATRVLLSAGCLLVSCGGSGGPGPPPPSWPDGRPEFLALLAELDAAPSSRVTWVGESITEQAKGGLGFTTFIEQAHPAVAYSNHGVGGNTTLDVVQRLPEIISTGADLYVVAIGMNDARYNDARGATTEGAFIENMRAIIEPLQATGARVAVISIWPTFWRDQFAVLGREATDARMVEWNAALHALCASELSVPFVDAYGPLVRAIDRGNVDSLVPDGVHPDWDGARFVGTAGREAYAHAVMVGPP